MLLRRRGNGNVEAQDAILGVECGRGAVRVQGEGQEHVQQMPRLLTFQQYTITAWTTNKNDAIINC